MSEASDPGGSTYSSGVGFTVNNPLPSTSILIPPKGATLSGKSATLDASTSNATSVEFYLFGGIYGVDAPVICTATLTQYGWLCAWNTTTVPERRVHLGVRGLRPWGKYGQFERQRHRGESSPCRPCQLVLHIYGLGRCRRKRLQLCVWCVQHGYSGHAAVGNVTLNIAGSATPSTFTGSFTITTGVGALSGSATGPIITQEMGVDFEQIYQIALSVNTATGSFGGTTGVLLFSTSSQADVASVAVE